MAKCILKDCCNDSNGGEFKGALCAPCHTLITTLPAKSVLTRVAKLRQEAVGLVHNIMNAAMKDG